MVFSSHILNQTSTRVMAMNQCIHIISNENIIQFIQHPLVCIASVAIILAVILQKLKAINEDVNVPRVYVSESSFIQRWTDKFRTVSRGQEAVSKGYRMVQNFGRNSLILQVS
jgi:hypothetical protein